MIKENSMKTMTVTINGKKTTLVLIGTIMDYDPRDPEETFEGSFFDDVWMNPKTKEVYVEMTLYDGALYEYNGKRIIEYIDSKFITCSIEAAYQKEPNNNIDEEYDSPFNWEE